MDQSADNVTPNTAAKDNNESSAAVTSLSAGNQQTGQRLITTEGEAAPKDKVDDNPSASEQVQSSVSSTENPEQVGSVSTETESSSAEEKPTDIKIIKEEVQSPTTTSNKLRLELYSMLLISS